MKIKLKKAELLSLIQELHNTEKVTFNTKLEARLCGAILVDLLKSLIKKAIDEKPQRTIELNTQQMFALNFVLPQLTPSHELDKIAIYEIITQINRECLSI